MKKVLVIVTAALLLPSLALAAGRPSEPRLLVGNDVKFGNKMTQYTNLLRQRLELSPLHNDKCLQKAAYLKASDMVRRKYFDHQGPSGDEDFAKFVWKAGCHVDRLGENMTQGDETPHDAYSSLKSSRTHYPVMTRDFYHRMGVGVAHFDDDSEPNTYTVTYYAD